MPSVALAISLFVLSQSALLVRLAKGASALDIGFWRMTMAIPLLFAVGALQGKLSELTRVTRRQIAWLAVTGFFLYLHWFTWFLAVQTTSLANAMVLFAMSPLWTALGAWIFFREPFHRRHAFALACCFFGVSLIFRDSLSFNPERLRGDCLGFMASILFSAYVLVGKGIRRQLGNLPFTLIAYSFCGLMFLATLLLTGKLHADFEPQAWWALAGLAVGPTLLGHALFTYCLEYFNVNLMNILILIEPVIGSATAFLVLGEAFSAGAVGGFSLVCVGMLGLFVPALARKAAR
jgi:drug/metabolite transporter (DMT)-like permease